MKKNENGYLVVEALGSLIPFVMAIVTILSIIKVQVVNSKVHYAVTQTAADLSMYSHILKPLGMVDILQSVDTNAQAGQAIVNTNVGYVSDVTTGLSGVADASSVADITTNVEQVVGGITGLSSSVSGLMSDPMETIAPLINLCLNESKNYAISLLVMEMMEKHLETDTTDADTYLRGLGVVDGLDGISLSGTSFIDSEGDITIVATYEVEYGFGWFTFTTTSQQTAKTRAWIGGGDD